MNFIYYLCTSDGIPRYVGKTDNLERRLFYHKRLAIRSPHKSSHKDNWIKKILSSNQEINICPIVIVDKDWEVAEKYWIKKFKEFGFNLTNHTEGGEGFCGQHSPESRLRISKAKMGKKMSDENRVKLKGQRNHLVKVYQYSMQNVFIREWPCALDAARNYHKTHSNGITATCRGKQKSALGFKWSYNLKRNNH